MTKFKELLNEILGSIPHGEMNSFDDHWMPKKKKLYAELTDLLDDAGHMTAQKSEQEKELLKNKIQKKRDEIKKLEDEMHDALQKLQDKY
jgi:ElaB/YqjD/DUF883 family membrane-anchored ribosome-binding protein